MTTKWFYRFDTGRVIMGKLSGDFGGRLCFSRQSYRPQNREGFSYSGTYYLVIPHAYDCPKRYRRRARGKWRQMNILMGEG
jgi:hypothetical protein